MAMARAAMRLAPRLLRPGARSEQQQLVRRYTDVLKEEERAQENIYIKRMERERAEKLEKQRAQQEHQSKEEPHRHPDGTPKTEEEVTATKTKGIAMAAGVVALASCVYWYATSGKKKVVDEE